MSDMDPEARLAAIVSSSDDAIVSKDLHGIVQTWNAAAERMFGYTADEAIGRSITIIIPDERLDEERDVLLRIVQGKGVDHFETVRRRKDGQLIDISLTVSPIRLPSGEIVGASKIARDISEQKQLRRAAEEASRAKDEFLATLSHELRTPLNTVLGYTHMLQTGAIGPQDMARTLDAIGRNAEALAQLVNDVLDTSRIVTGKIRLNFQECDLGVLAAEAVDAIIPAARGKSIQVVTEIEDGLVLSGDPDRLRQVLWNLLSNSVKFTPAGGLVRLTAQKRDGSVHVAVEDSGVGIPPEWLPFVFQRFWQGEAGHVRGNGGLGLGLALVRHFVELHGGTVTAHSDGPGRGSRFAIVLPSIVQAASERPALAG
jgi:PAS domain S-box-containing protein